MLAAIHLHRPATSDLWYRAMPMAGAAVETWGRSRVGGGGAARRRGPDSVLLIFEKLSGHNDPHAVAIRVWLACQIEIEVNRAHDAVAEFLLDQRLKRRAIDLDDI